MPSTSSSLLSYLRVVVGVWRDDPRDDAVLLARFAEAQDEAAFATLVWRHGALVWQTCRRILGDTPDAEDAFQSTFLALARKAGRFPVKSLAGWLHRVARQAALDARTGIRRRRGLEQRLRDVTQPEAEGPIGRAEVYAALDEELADLPEQLRVPLLLHYLEGKSQDEVAHFLGCSRFVVRKRLARGEAILRKRLERRGLEVGILSVGALLGDTAGASAVPARLIGSTARMALRSLSFPLSESSKAAALAEGVMKTMLMTRMKIITVLLGLTLCLAGGGLLAYHALTGNAVESPQPAGETRGEAGASRQLGAAARVDCLGDPLPAHALARMGTVRLWYGEGGPPYRAFAFSPNGKTLATKIDDRTVCLWDATTGKEIRRLTTKANKRKNGNGVWFPSVVLLGFSPDGKTLVAVSYAQTVHRWEVATGKLLHKQEYQGPKNLQFSTVAFLPDGKMLGFGDFLKSDEAGRVRGVWDVASGKEICQLNEPTKKEQDIIKCMAFSQDGKLLASAMWEEEGGKTVISIWDIATGKKIRQLSHEASRPGRIISPVHRVAFSPDGKTLASLATEPGQTICVWEVATGKKIHLFKAPVADSNLLTFSPDGKTLLSGAKGDLWDVGTGKKIRSFGWEEGTEVGALFSPDGKVLAMGDQAGSIRLWETATGKEIGPRKDYRAGIASIAYSSDGKTLASMGKAASDLSERTVRLWEVATGKEIRQLGKHTGIGSGSIAYSPDGKMLVSMDNSRCCWGIHLWDTATGKEIRQFAKNGMRPSSAIFSPDGKILAIGASGARGGVVVILWEVATGKEIYTLSVVQGEVYHPVPVAFSPDGRMLAAPGKDNTVCLWEVTTGKPICQLGGLNRLAGGLVRFLAFSPNGQMLATSNRGDDKIHLWGVASGKEIGQLAVFRRKEHQGERWEQDSCVLAFSPDSRVLATAAEGVEETVVFGNFHKTDGYFDPRVRLWEVASGQEIGQLVGHQGIIRTIAFSPDGKSLASGSDDLTCLVWDVTPFTDRLKLMPARPLPAQALSPERLEAAWADLAKEPAKAYAAIRALQAAPKQAIALLQARVRPVAPLTDPQQLQRWLADLNANSFTVRDKAQQEIEKLGEVAVPVLRQALQGRPTLEVKRRLKDLLAELEPKLVIVSPRRLRELRAVQVLEFIGTAEARQLLQAWAKGVTEARLTQEAQAALARLAKRAAAKP